MHDGVQEFRQLAREAGYTIESDAPLVDKNDHLWTQMIICVGAWPPSRHTFGDVGYFWEALVVQKVSCAVPHAPQRRICTTGGGKHEYKLIFRAARLG
jgi:hypothetical protein